MIVVVEFELRDGVLKMCFDSGDQFIFLSGESGRDMEVRVDESDDGFEFLDPE